MSKPLISIVIPTYNRPHRLLELFQSMLASQRNWQDGNWEIVVSDNHSPQNILEIVKAHKSELPISYCKPEHHLETAEENFLFGWSKATGRYVWVLGDDDPLEFSSLDLLISLCSEGHLDAMVWDSRIIGPRGGLLRYERVPHSELINEMSLRDFTLSSGFWYVGAGISAWVVKRISINPDAVLAMIQGFESTIYGHVTAFITLLRDSKFAFVASNLISYRVTYAEDEPWSNFAKRHDIPKNFPWTVGFALQLNRLVSEGLYSWQALGKAIEQHHNGRPFLLVSVMLEKTIEQVIAGLADDKQAFNSEQLKWLLSVLAIMEPKYIEFIQLIRNLEHVSAHGSKRQIREYEAALKDSLALFRLNQRNFPFWNLFIKSINGWWIFQGPLKYFAVPAGSTQMLEFALISGNYQRHPQLLFSESLGDLMNIASGSSIGNMDNYPGLPELPDIPFDFFSSSAKQKPAIIRFVARFMPSKIKALVASWVIGA